LPEYYSLNAFMIPDLRNGMNTICKLRVIHLTLVL